MKIHHFLTKPSSATQLQLGS